MNNYNKNFILYIKYYLFKIKIYLKNIIKKFISNYAYILIIK